MPEQLELKHPVLRAISAAADPAAIIATNTSALPVGDLAEVVAAPERFLGVHWFGPAPFVPLVELAGGTAEVTERVAAMLRAAGKVPVQVPDVPGFIGNRLQFALYREAALVVEEGLADAATVDTVVSNSFGLRLPFFGPLLVGDIAGLDVYESAFRSLEAQYGERFAPPQSLVERVAAGDLGVKTGGGLRGRAGRPAPGPGGAPRPELRRAPAPARRAGRCAHGVIAPSPGDLVSAPRSVSAQIRSAVASSEQLVVPGERGVDGVVERRQPALLEMPGPRTSRPGSRRSVGAVAVGVVALAHLDADAVAHAGREPQVVLIMVPVSWNTRQCPYSPYRPWMRR